MSRDRQDDTARFMQAIAAFSAELEPVGELGRPLCQSPELAVDRILVEISETLLRRCLTFAGSSGAQVLLDVAERRVHRVLAIPVEWRAEFGALVGVDLTEGQGVGLVRLFRQLAQNERSLFVQSGLPDREKTAGFAGVSLRELQDAHAAIAELAGVPSPLSDALIRVRNRATGLCFVGSDGALTTDGSDDLCRRLQTFVQILAAQEAEETTVRLWSGEFCETSAVLTVQSDHGTGALVVPVQEMLAAFAELQACCIPTPPISQPSGKDRVQG